MKVEKYEVVWSGKQPLTPDYPRNGETRGTVVTTVLRGTVKRAF